MLLSAIKNKVISTKWALILSLAILCAQFVRLHIHDIDHDYPAHDEIGASVHNSIAPLHFVNDQSHADHHDGIMLEIETTPSVLTKYSPHLIPVLAIITAIFAVLLLNQPIFRLCRVRENRPLLSERSFLTPPLRAPPVARFI